MTTSDSGSSALPAQLPEEQSPEEPRVQLPAQPPGDPAKDPPRREVRITTGLTTDVLDVGAAHDDVVDAEAGGVGVFSGVVRNHHDGRRVREITYEAWEELAPGALRDVADDVVARHPGVRAVHVVHRLGRLDVGEVSIVCAASAPHRDEALRAASALIDEVKERVPVWKREVFADGTVGWPGTSDAATPEQDHRSAPPSQN